MSLSDVSATGHRNNVDTGIMLARHLLFQPALISVLVSRGHCWFIFPEFAVLRLFSVTLITNTSVSGETLSFTVLTVGLWQRPVFILYPTVSLASQTAAAVCKTRAQVAKWVTFFPALISVFFPGGHSGDGGPEFAVPQLLGVAFIRDAGGGGKALGQTVLTILVG